MSGIRVIAGVARGRRIRAVPGETTRPISDRAKEALFSIIGPDICESTFLDLFGGTGSAGVEALSRGAERAVFLDTGREAIKTIQANLSTTGLSQHAEVLRYDALTYLAQEPRNGFDYVYIAPPQFQGLWVDALELLDKYPGWVKQDGWVIAQIHPTEFIELTSVKLRLFDQRRYGNTLLCFYSVLRGGQYDTSCRS